MSKTYTSIPFSTRFDLDTTVMLKFRNDDPYLKCIDRLLDRYHWSKKSQQEVVLCELFQTCNYWIKRYHQKDPVCLKERYPAVLALFEAVADELAVRFGCTETRGDFVTNPTGEVAAFRFRTQHMQVAHIIQQIYGRDMHVHGIQVDQEDLQARYLDRAERAIYRLTFKAGLAYQYQWWLGLGRKTKQVLAESKFAYAALRRAAESATVKTSAFIGWGMLVITLERDVYMAKPDIGQGMFHSSLTRGGRVTFAGTVFVRAGKVLGIRPDSGHYKPTETNMALALQVLAMHGVNLNELWVFDYMGRFLATGREFLKSGLSMRKLMEQKDSEEQHRKASDRYRDFVSDQQDQRTRLRQNAVPVSAPAQNTWFYATPAKTSANPAPVARSGFYLSQANTSINPAPNSQSGFYLSQQVPPSHPLAHLVLHETAYRNE